MQVHTRMDVDLMKFVNSDLTWNAVKKGRRSIWRRRPKASNAGNKIQDTIVYDYEKSVVAILGQRFAEEVIDVPIKKRKLMLQSEPISKHPSDEQLNLLKKDVPDLNDLSGIELLAAAAALHSSFKSSEVEEYTTPKVDADIDGVKDDIIPMDSDINGNFEGDKSHVPSKVARLHWDLNTMMDEWEQPFCDDYNDNLQDVKSGLEDYETKNLKITEDEKGSSKPEIFDTESFMSKSDVIDSFVHPDKRENGYTSTVSVSLEQTTIKVESINKSYDDDDDKIYSEDRLSDCCGSNDSEDEQTEENKIDKINAGYDSPAEDGELREPIRFHNWEKEEVEETECVDYESDNNMYEDNFEDIESIQTEIPIDCNKTIEALGVEMVNESQQGDKADAFVPKDDSSAKFHTGRKIGGNLDRSTSTSFGAHKNIACIRRSRSDNFQDSYSRAKRDFGPEKFMGRDRTSYHDSAPWADPFSRNGYGYPKAKNGNPDINYNPRGRDKAFNTRPPPSDRHESYGGIVHRGTQPTKGITRDRNTGRFRRTLEEEYNYPDKKIQTFSSDCNRGGNFSQFRKRSRSRSRSGSPIAWHFQKKRFLFRNPNSSGEMEASRRFDNRKVINTQYKERRSSPVRPFSQSQRVDLARLNSRDDKYGMMNEKRRFRYDVNESYKGRYHNKDNGFRYKRNEN